MARKVNKTSGKTATKDKEPEEKPIPEFLDEDGVLNKLKRQDFPKSVAGQQAFCDYQIAKWEVKKGRIAERNDPKAKAKRKLEKYKKLIEALEAEIDDEDE